MANEHLLLTQKTFPISMTCAVGTGIEKGSVLKLSDENTVAASTAANDLVAGVAYTEKIANDGMVQIAVLAGPGDELRAIASGSIGVGDPLVTAVGPTSNYLASGVGLSVTELSGTRVLGFSKATATVGQTFRYVLNIGSLPRV